MCRNIAPPTLGCTTERDWSPRSRQCNRRSLRIRLCGAFFDLLELNGKDLRRQPIEERKRVLAKLLRSEHPGIALNQHYDGDGAIIYKHARALGCEDIVSKRLGSPYRAGRSDYWLKIKNPDAPAVKREAEEDWA
jgi:ATP-dependent DNA ligase